MRRALLAALLLAAPTAVALDALPTYTRLGDEEARVLVRLPHGGRLLVEAAPGVRVGVTEPEGPTPELTPAPAEFAVEARAPEASWHGLSGTVDVVARRDDPRQAVMLVIRDASGGGTEVEWPAAPEPRRWLPAPDALAAVAAVAIAVALATGRRGAPPSS